MGGMAAGGAAHPTLRPPEGPWRTLSDVHPQETRKGSVTDETPGGALTDTFVVRLWQPPDASRGTTLGLRGVVEHLRSGESTAFGDEDTLLAFLRGTGRTT